MNKNKNSEPNNHLRISSKTSVDSTVKYCTFLLFIQNNSCLYLTAMGKAIFTLEKVIKKLNEEGIQMKRTDKRSIISNKLIKVEVKLEYLSSTHKEKKETEEEEEEEIETEETKEDEKKSDDLNEITIQYIATKGSQWVKLFGYDFVERSKEFLTIIFNGKQFPLKEFLKINNPEIDETITIRLVGVQSVNDITYMFKGVSSLSPSFDASQLNKFNFTSMEGIFEKCNTVPDLSKLDTKNVENMSRLFANCSDLGSLSDISNFNTEKVTDFSEMFLNCKSLKSLPDISGWKTNKIENTKSMFQNCQNLENIPNFFNFENIRNVRVDNMFLNCKLLKSLPDLSKINIKSTKSLKSFFNPLLTIIPDISKWDTSTVTDMSGLFKGCSLLKSLPDISNWNMSEVTDMSEMFSDCSSVVELPDMRKWNTPKLKKMQKMFYNCSNLKSIDISNFETKNVQSLEKLFYNCKSLIFPERIIPDIKNVKCFSKMFYKCDNIQRINCSRGKNLEKQISDSSAKYLKYYSKKEKDSLTIEKEFFEYF
jgi:surface protein